MPKQYNKECGINVRTQALRHPGMKSRPFHGTTKLIQNEKRNKEHLLELNNDSTGCLLRLLEYSSRKEKQKYDLVLH